jgi:hypothetical protein
MLFMIYSTGKKQQEKSMIIRISFQQILFSIALISLSISGFSQISSQKGKGGNFLLDSLKKSGVIIYERQNKPEIILSRDQAIQFLQQRTTAKYWIDPQDPFRKALNHLIYESSHERYDSLEYYLRKYPYDSLSIPWDKFYIWEPLRLNISMTAASPIPQADSVLKADSTSIRNLNQYLRLKSDSARIPSAENKVALLKDTTFLVVIDTLNEVTSTVSSFPFRYLDYPYQGDSIRVAVTSLMKYLQERDSSTIKFTGIGKSVVPVWMNSKSPVMKRYWLKNEFADSVTVWIGNTSKDTIGLYLEQGINFRRPVKQGNFSDAKINVKPLDNSKLLEIQKIAVKPHYWRYRSEASFILSQTALSNWVKGGENSISSLLDITGFADYNNKAIKVSSNNFIRMKLGFLKSGANPLRKNVDLLETNSKLNHKAFGKFDFSGILLFKTQVAVGKNYNSDPPKAVSKFFNPAILTAGIGLDYKPNKNTSFNFSPISYKGTFVTDTAMIDQTLYGIPKGKKSLNEPGVSLMVTNEYKPYKNVTITNRLQLFTNYINNPQNVDVDWEMNIAASLNWFTDVRFNTHLIFDDDTKTVVLDENKQPELNPDGSVKKTARIQFKEMLGFSLVFRF